MVHPIASMSWRTENHAILAIGIAWVVILALSAPAFVIHGEVSEQDAKHEARPRAGSRSLT